MIAVWKYYNLSHDFHPVLRALSTRYQQGGIAPWNRNGICGRIAALKFDRRDTSPNGEICAAVIEQNCSPEIRSAFSRRRS